MQKRPNDPSISVGRIYDVFSYAEGKLEVFTLNFEQQKGKYLLSSHLVIILSFYCLKNVLV